MTKNVKSVLYIYIKLNHFTVQKLTFQINCTSIKIIITYNHRFLYNIVIKLQLLL